MIPSFVDLLCLGPASILLPKLLLVCAIEEVQIQLGRLLLHVPSLV
jgi:hypothetical protein